MEIEGAIILRAHSFIYSYRRGLKIVKGEKKNII